MRLKIKNVNIMGVHQFLGEGESQKKQKTIYMGNCLKRGLEQFAGAWQKTGRRVFLRGV